jgi:DNA-binding transcriptional regulator/RsmH inhibitor MraZ
MKLDVKGRLMVGKILEEYSKKNSKEVLKENSYKEKVKEKVYFCVLEIKEKVFLIVSKDTKIERNHINKFAKEYIGESNYNDFFAFNGYLSSEMDSVGRISLSNDLLYLNKLKEDKPEFVLKNYVKLEEEGVVVFSIEDKSIFRKEQLTEIDTNS